MTLVLGKLGGGEGAKVIFDVGYDVNEVSDFWSTSGAGYLDDPAGENDQVVVRTQMQVLF